MNDSYAFGINAEKEVELYLTNRNFTILERNWRTSHLEIDIIAKQNNFIVIVEVKARKNKYLNFDEIISLKKQKNLITAAEKYLEIKNLDEELRFDVAFVTIKNSNFDIEYIENAFYSMPD